MPGDATTDREWPPPTTPGGKALAHARKVLARPLEERQERGGRNQGPIVRECVEWLFRAHGDMALYERLYRGGNLPWCACFAGWCYAESGTDVARWWSASCDSLWVRLLGQETRGRVQVRRWPVDPQSVEPGDLTFWGDPGDLNHVDLWERCDGTTLWTIGGNTGHPVANRVDRTARLLVAADRLFGVARGLA